MLTSQLDPVIGFNTNELVAVDTDLEPQPILFLRGRRPGASATASNGEVLFASPSANEGNDGRSIQTVGDRSIGVYLRRPYDMISFDGLLAYRSESPNPGQPSDLF